MSVRVRAQAPRMRRTLCASHPLRRGLVGIGLLISTASAQTPTFHEDVEPLLQRHCQGCHHQTGMAPFSLEEYADVVGWAPTMREVLATRRMPPWSADPSIGQWANDRSLPDDELATLLAWIDGGTLRGDPAKAPARTTWKPGWQLGTPDLVLTSPEKVLPAEGTLPYEYAQIQTSFATDRWVRALEVGNSGKDVVHHVLVFLEENETSRERTRELWASRPWRPVFNQLELLQGSRPQDRLQWMERFRHLERDLRHGEAGGLNGYFAAELAGNAPLVFPADEAKLLPAGATVTFQIHYTPNGKPAKSQTHLALYFRDTPPPRALDCRGIATVVFEIPPGVADHEVQARYVLPRAALLRSLGPHMHLRGKSFRFEADYPDGTHEVLLQVPKYDFNWQHAYLLAHPVWLPEGTVLRAIARYDNSKANPVNPDPGQTVFFGLQTSDEMMIGYFEVAWAQSDEESEERSKAGHAVRE